MREMTPLNKATAIMIAIIVGLLAFPQLVQLAMNVVYVYWGYLCGVFNKGEWGVNGGIHGWPLATFIVWGVASGIIVMTVIYVFWCREPRVHTDHTFVDKVEFMRGSV